MNSTADRDRSQAPPPLLVSDRATLSLWIAGCPHAQTLTGFSAAENSEVLISLRCNQWSCRYCAERKISLLAAKTREAKPNRLLTLTVDPALYDSPRQAFDKTRGKLSDLIAALRSRFGQVEYLRVTELTARGWPHYHLLVRSAYLPQAVVAAEWRRLTGARIVDLRRVKPGFNSFTYLFKYLSKLHKIEWTERHVSTSRAFFAPEPGYQPRSLSLQAALLHNTHPVEYALENLAGCTLSQVTPTVYRVSGVPPSPEEF